VIWYIAVWMTNIAVKKLHRRLIIQAGAHIMCGTHSVQFFVQYLYKNASTDLQFQRALAAESGSVLV
jgi:hypothetical protein